MRLFAIILTLCTFLSAQQSPNAFWEVADDVQKEHILWYAHNYGVSIGAKNVLETSGGKYLNHDAKEETYGDLGISLATARSLRPGLSNKVLREMLIDNRHFQGQLAQEIDEENAKRMRNKQRPALCTTMVYQGWRKWNNKGRLNRGLLDLQWQEFLRSLGWE